MNSLDIETILSASADPASGRLMLAAFEKAYMEAFESPFDWTSAAAKRLLSIFGNSAVLSEKMVRNPGWADSFVNDPDWDKQKNRKHFFLEICSLADQMKPRTESAWQKLLRSFKYRHMIRIVCRDLNKASPTQAILEEWSDIADVVIQKAYDAALNICSSRFGEPLWQIENGQFEACRGMVIALGKLGSRELNMSSDVDLLCLYESDEGGTSGGPSGKITNHEFFTKAVSLMTKLLSPVTEDGFAFRCDHDLRPEGPKGPLVNSVLAAERYYETFGQDWERQMLIRARPVAGDMPMAEAFLEYISPFVYRRSLSFNDLTHLKVMKEKIESQSVSHNLSMNIKLGPGGIRELEFLVQGFQQVYGGHIRKIRTPNTIEAIEALGEYNLIHPHGVKVLKDGYSFLRRLENMIQIPSDLQTHSMPDEPLELTALARRMGCTADDEQSAQDKLLSEWKRHAATIHRLFMGLFEEDYRRLELIEAVSANIASCTTPEEKADSLPWFKSQEVKRLARLDLENKIALPELLKRLSLIAEVVIGTAWEQAINIMKPRFGLPYHPDGSPAHFAIIGFGRLGSQEIDYGSDLDLCFLYSGEGKTDGHESISNQEFYTRLSQRIISLISINSRYGRAYIIDSELRPSGHQGSLVATLSSFADYHVKKSQIWERLALLKARAIAGDETFIKEVHKTLDQAAYQAAVPDESTIKKEINNLRLRFEEAAIEKEDSFNLKTGYGGMSDVERVIQYIQLINAAGHKELWIQNGFKIIDTLHELSLIDEELFDQLGRSYHFYRRIISYIRLFTNSATDSLNIKASYAELLGRQLDFPDTDSLVDTLKDLRERNRSLFKDYFDGD